MEDKDRKISIKPIDDDPETYMNSILIQGTNYYEIDYDKVKTIKDIKNILETLIVKEINIPNGHEDAYSNIMHLLNKQND